MHTVHIVTRSDELSIGVVDWLDFGSESVSCYIYDEEMANSIGIMTLIYKNINRLECIERTNSVRIYIKNQVVPTNNMIYEIMYINSYYLLLFCNRSTYNNNSDGIFCIRYTCIIIIIYIY